jgi:hypothetical protein
MVAGLVFATSAYLYLTRPARLHAAVVGLLAAADIDVGNIGAVSFSFSDGLELLDVDLGLRSGSQAAAEPGEGRLSARLRVARACIRCNPFELATGRPRVRQVVLHEADLALLCQPPGATPDAESGTRTGRWLALLPQVAGAASWPTIHLASGYVRLLAVTEGAPQLVRQWRVTGYAAPRGAGYHARLVQVGGGDVALAELSWDTETAVGELATGWLDLESAAAVLPRTLADTFAQWVIRGRVRVEHLALSLGSLGADEASPAFRAPHLETARLSIADGRCALPVEASDVGSSPSRRFAQVSDARIALELTSSPDGGGQVVVHGAGRLNGAPVAISLDARPSQLTAWPPVLDGPLEGELRLERCALPTKQEHADFVLSPHLPRGVHGFLNDFEPEGVVNLSLRFQRASGETAAGGAALHFEGEVEPLGCRCRYDDFPYPFEDVRGRVRFSPAGIVLDGLVARHGSARVRATGTVDRPRRASGLDLTFAGSNVPLDAELFTALPPEYQRLWSEVAPIGLCDVLVRLQRADAAPDAAKSEPTDVRVDARLRAGSLSLDTQQRLQCADGAVTIAGGVVTVHELHGYLDDGAVRLAGTVAVAGGAEQLDLVIEAQDVPVERRAVVRALPGEAVAEISFTGRADVWGRVRGVGLRGAHETEYTVHVKDGSLAGFDPRQSWADCEGWLTVTPERQLIHSFSARQAAARLEIGGTLPSGPDGPESAVLEVRVSAAPLDELVRQFVPPAWREQVAALGLGGTGDVALQVGPAEEAGGATKAAALVQIAAERMAAAVLPVELRDVRARATLAANVLDVHEFNARQGAAGAVTADGRFRWNTAGRAADFSLRVAQVELTEALVAALPAPLARLLQRMQAGGLWGADLDRVRLEDDGRPTWDFAGRVMIDSGTLDLGLPLTGVVGQLAGTCHVRPDGQVALQAGLAVERGEVAGRPLANWAGQLEYNPDEPWVRLDDLHGRLCDGDVLGYVHISPETSDYELSLTLQDVALQQLWPGQAEPAAAPRRGRLDGHIYLRGRASDVDARRGGGSLRIRGGSILNTPVLAKVAAADERTTDVYDTAEVRFMWAGAELQLTRVELQSRDLRLVGHGTWNMSTDEIALLLVGAHPRNWPRVAVLTDLLETTGRELVQYHVRGTVAEPQVSAEPLYKLNEALRALLAGDR